MKNSNEKTLKSIRGKLRFHCTGSFNFDANDAVWNEQKLLNYKVGKGKENNKVVKKDWVPLKKVTIPDEPKYGFRPKISENCIRHLLFEEAMPHMYPESAIFPRMLYSIITSPEAIIRGYMFANDKMEGICGAKSLKKTSALTICDLVGDIDPMTVPIYELRTRSGYKSDEKDNSLYNVEQVPACDYVADMAIDLSKIEFLSCDDSTNNRAFGYVNSEYCSLYFDNLRRNLQLSETPEVKAYYWKNGIAGNTACEEGFVLDSETRVMLVKKLLKDILRMKREHKGRGSTGSILSLLKMDLVLIYNDGTEEELNDVDEKTVDGLSFEPESFYCEADNDILKERHASLEVLDGNKNKNNTK